MVRHLLNNHIVRQLLYGFFALNLTTLVFVQHKDPRETPLSAFLDRSGQIIIDPRLTSSRQPDVTAIILNWSRFSNVLRISSLLCGDDLEDTITSVIVFNNSPNRISAEDFLSTGCAFPKLRIINSPSNVLFEARYLACSDATTAWCFIQDDDYLVSPEVIWSMRHQVAEGRQEPIYLGPPHEQLLKHLRQVRSFPWSSSFSWLGYGSILARKEARLFLEAMDSLDFDNDERAMADNYFSVLRNTIPETWFDHNTELGGGQPFTVGTAGNERNNVHILRATEYLSMLFPYNSSSDIKAKASAAPPFVRRPEDQENVRKAVYKAPCLQSACVLETSIQIFSRFLSSVATKPTDMLAAEQENSHWLAADQLPFHLSHPLSNAVDGLLNTPFRSQDIKPGDYISFDVLQRADYPTMKMLWVVDPASAHCLQRGQVLVGDSTTSLMPIRTVVSCANSEADELGTLSFCSASVPAGRHFRLAFQDCGGGGILSLYEVRLILRR